MKKTLLALLFSTVATSVIAQGMDNMDMDHSKMDHGSMPMMDMEGMDHSKMDHSSMDMSMEGMSEVGMPAKGSKPDKVVHVLLSDDMKITFKKEVKIEPNDVVQFVVMNTGKIDHEFSIGSMKEQLAHRDMMKNMAMDHDHDSGGVVTVKPGKAKQLMWHFHGKPEEEFACNIPGHAEARSEEHTSELQSP